MTKAELGERISSQEITAWQAFELLEGPIGPERADLQAAVGASVVANVNRKKGKQPHPLNDFVPDWAKAAEELQKEETQPLSGSEQRDAMIRAMGANPATVERKRLLDAKGNEMPTTEERKARDAAADAAD